MITWSAVSAGALDITGTASSTDLPGEIVINPIFPSPPLAISDDVAALWRSLVGSGRSEDRLSETQRALVSEFESAGIAVAGNDHPNIVTVVERPWFVSSIHELVTALVANAARERGVRCLVIKGPSLHAQGLRSRAHSGDVDVLVEPNAVQAMIGAMGEWGWRLRADPMAGTAITHAYTLLPDSWGCEIDVHVRIPGIASDAADVFDVLWSNSEPRNFAGIPACTVSPQAHAVLYALNLVRPVPGQPLRGTNAEAVRALQQGGVDSLRLAIAVDASGALRRELLEAFKSEHVPFAAPPPDWKWLSQSNPARVYFMMLRSLPWRARPRVLWRIISWGGDTSHRERGAYRLARGIRQLLRGGRS